uniref:Uncharacterized protein LOC100187501 n=1 Tax=Phallusia mammillata TaxID=59560 RepID=A0A6F9DHZ0_9ASCI|nr:uncharacterized protein LOC100187501 [Phallusia mammillata]
MCLSFVTSTVTLATLKITCSPRNAMYQPFIRTILQALMIFEVQSIIAESISNQQLCRSISKLPKLVLLVNAIALIAPMAVTLISSAYELTSTSGNDVFVAYTPFDSTYITYNTSQTTLTYETPENSTQPPSSTFGVYKHPDDPLLLLEPLFIPNAEDRSFQQQEKQSELQKQIEMISEQTGTTVGLYERILMIKYLEEVDKYESYTHVCWMTWPSSGLLITYIIVTLSSCYGYALALRELRHLKYTSTTKVVPLESWLACVVRPTVITVTLLKWIAVSLEWHSFHCLYTICIAMCIIPFLYAILIGPRRCNRSGAMKRGFLSKRFEKLSYRGLQTATDCRRRNIGSYSVGFNLGLTTNFETQRYNMLQLEETRPSLVRGGDVIINQNLSDFVRERDVTKEHGVFDADSRDLKSNDVKRTSNSTESEDEGYGVIKRFDVVDVAADLAKCKLETNRGSVFDDSDYDEVMDFMASPTSSTCEETKVIEEATIPESSPTCEDPDLDNSSKRSSAASQVESVASSGTLSSSGVESSDEKPNPKYASLDIAKILHTRKRIQHSLHTPQANEIKPEPAEEEPPTSNTMVTKKKSSSVYKRHTHYGTLGRRSKSSSKRASSISRPLSGSENDYTDSANYQPGDYSTFDPSRSRKIHENHFTFERPKSRDSDSDGNSDTNRSSGGFEGGSKRWSRLSANSQNSDKAISISPQKGPFKAFRRFVYSTSSANVNSTGPLSHEEKKAMIQICVADANSNNNNSSHPNVEDNMTRGEYAMHHDAKKNSYSCIPVGSVDATAEYSFSPRTDSSPRRDTHSLLRKLSKKSSPTRGRDPRRSSLPSQSMYDVRSTSQPPVNDVTPPRFQYGDGSQPRSDIESRVMESVERNDRSKSEGKSLQKSGSLKRLFSFAKRRPSVKKSPVKRRDTEPASTMNKSLSYSSPQLSVFAVNSPGTRTSKAGLAQKLVF